MSTVREGKKGQKWARRGPGAKSGGVGGGQCPWDWEAENGQKGGQSGVLGQKRSERASRRPGGGGGGQCLFDGDPEIPEIQEILEIGPPGRFFSVNNQETRILGHFGRFCPISTDSGRSCPQSGGTRETGKRGQKVTFWGFRGNGAKLYT